MGTPRAGATFRPSVWETAIMRQSVRQTRARWADRKSRPPIFYFERNPKIVQSIASPYIVRSLPYSHEAE